MGLRCRVFTVGGTYTPTTQTAAWVTALGGGSGAGCNSSGNDGGGSGGGGAAELCQQMLVPVTAPVMVTIGAGGQGATSFNPALLTGGGHTSFGSVVARGAPVPVLTEQVSGAGGGIGGGIAWLSFGTGKGNSGNIESPHYWGGGGGGACGPAFNTGGRGGDDGGRLGGNSGPTDGLTGTGGGGGSTMFGEGGNAPPAGSGGSTSSYGAGAAGASGNHGTPCNGGSGAPGVVCTFWVA